MTEEIEAAWMELKAVVLEELNLFDEMTDELVFEVIDNVFTPTGA